MTNKSVTVSIISHVWLLVLEMLFFWEPERFSFMFSWRLSFEVIWPKPKSRSVCHSPFTCSRCSHVPAVPFGPSGCLIWGQLPAERRSGPDWRSSPDFYKPEGTCQILRCDIQQYPGPAPVSHLLVPGLGWQRSPLFYNLLLLLIQIINVVVVFIISVE